MGVTNRDLLILILNVVVGLVYLVILFLALRRQKGIASPALWLAGYALLALVVQALQFSGIMGWLPGMDAYNRLRLDQSAAVLLALLLYLGLRVFLNKERIAIWFVGGLVLVGGILLSQNFLAIFFSWILLTGVAVFQLLRALGKTSQHLHRSRMFFWMPALAFAIANELMVFYQLEFGAGYLRLGATIMLAYVILSHHVPDTRDFTRQLIIYLTASIITVAIYIGGFWLADTLLQQTPGYQPIFAGAGLAVVISLIFTPLFGAIRGIVNRLFRLESYDPAQTLREYSNSISNILELDKLVTVAVGLIMDALEIKKGVLFLIDPEIGEGSKHIYRLTGMRTAGGSAALTGILAEDSPITRYFREQHQPLLQYDIDFAPDFMDAPLQERKWLSELGLDVYAPISSKGDWIGLLALGPKPANRYTDEDLNLLAAIASQTGVALENARLVENLKKLNVQVREAYSFLDKANHDLAKLEMTKSNFISIASHELRTPLTVARGYAEMLLDDPSLPDMVRELVKGIHKSTIRLHEIMDSMFDIAQMDTRSIELQRQDLFITELVRSVAQELAKFASEREQELTLDLPQLSSIKADPNTLRKLFHHLIINAIKFTPNQGKVIITGRQVAPNNRDLPEGGVEIIVADTGVGIDKGLQEVIFTKFYQPGELLNRHSTGKTKFKGSGVGLGLALSRGIVDAHGGKIWVESPGYDEDKCPGSEFHVILPTRSQGESKTVRMGSAVKLKL